MTGELGISGTANQLGDILSEPNPNLYHQQAWGQPGQRSWGAYETIGKTDPDVSAAIEFALAQVRDARVDIEEPGEAQKDRALAETQTEFLRWALLERLEPGWADMLRQMGRAILPGFALHELVWEQVEHEMLPGGAGWSVVRMPERLPVSIHPQGWLEEDGELKGIKQTGLKGSTWVDVMLPADKVQLFSWNREGNNYLGTSAFRSVYYLTRVREQLLKIVGISYIREGAGVPIAEASDKSAKLSEKQRRKLFKLLANLVFHENAAAVMPAGWSMKWIHAPPANKQGVLQAWRELGEVILRQVGAQQLVLGVNGTGSRAVGEVHDVNADQFAAGLFASMESCLNGMGRRPYTGLAKKLIDANWGPQPAYPRIAIKPRKAKLPVKERAEAMKIAKESGFLVPTIEDENTLRDELGLKPRDPTNQPVATPAPQMPIKNPEDTADESEEETDPDQTPPLPPQKVEANVSRYRPDGPFQPRRPLRASEKKLDLQGMVDFLDSQKDLWEVQLKPLIVEMLAKAMPGVKEAMKDGDPSEVSTIALDSQRLLEAIQKLLDSAHEKGREHVRLELSKMGRAPSDDSEEDTGPPKIEAAARKPGQLTMNMAKLLTRQIETRLKQELEREAVDTVRRKGNPDDIVAKVMKRQLDSGAIRNDAAAANKAWNMGRDEELQVAARMGVELVEYSAVMDSGTCDVCEGYDGKQMVVGSAEYNMSKPPNAWCLGRDNCRCVMIPLDPSEAQ